MKKTLIEKTLIEELEERAASLLASANNQEVDASVFESEAYAKRKGAEFMRARAAEIDAAIAKLKASP